MIFTLVNGNCCAGYWSYLCPSSHHFVGNGAFLRSSPAQALMSAFFIVSCHRRSRSHALIHPSSSILSSSVFFRNSSSIVNILFANSRLSSAIYLRYLLSPGCRYSQLSPFVHLFSSKNCIGIDFLASSVALAL